MDKRVQALANFCETRKGCEDCPIYADPKANRINDTCDFDNMGGATLDYLLGVAKIVIEEDDPVNHPSHYTDGKIEVIEFIEDKKLGFHLGNAVKYICRAGKKDPNKEIEDLEKAKWYVERRISCLGGKSEVRVKVSGLHDAPARCYVLRPLLVDDSAPLDRCALGHAFNIKACEGCRFNIADKSLEEVATP